MKNTKIAIVIFMTLLIVFLPTKVFATQIYYEDLTTHLATTKESVAYLDESKKIQVCNNWIEVTDNINTLGTSNTTTWYVVKNNVTINDRITVLGDVNLILSDNTVFNALDGITVAKDNDFAVYAQSTSNSMGELFAKGPYTHAVNHYHSAGIGGTPQGEVGNITIHGGKITAIGGGYAAGIGGGYYGSAGGNKQHGYGGGNIKITGGMITATNENGTSGIGAGKSNDFRFEFQGSESKFSTGTNGDAVIRTTAFILDNEDKTNWFGVIFEKNNGNVYGDVSLTQDLTISKTENLTIGDHSRLNVPDNISIINNGRLIVENGGLLDGTGSIDTRNGNTSGLDPKNLTLICKINTTGITNITFNGEESISNKKDAFITLEANKGYKLPENISVTVQGKELTLEKYSYDYLTGNLIIPASEINGNVDIIASAKMLQKYMISINKIEGVTIIPSGDINQVLEGTNFNIGIKPHLDYKIKSIKVNGVEQTLPLVNDILTITDIKEDINVTIEVQKIYKDNLNSNNINKTDSSSFPKTGDSTQITCYISLLIVSILGVTNTIKYIRKKI